MPFYLTPKQDDFNKIPELQICIAEALYDVDSIVADPEAYTKEELASIHSQVMSNLEQAWELSDGSEDQLLSTMMPECGQRALCQKGFLIPIPLSLKLFIGGVKNEDKLSC